MSKTIENIDDVDSLDELAAEDLLYLMQREGTSQGPPADLIEDMSDELREQVAEALQMEPGASDRRTARQKRAAQRHRSEMAKEQDKAAKQATKAATAANKDVDSKTPDE